MRVKESNCLLDGQVLDLANLLILAELIVPISRFYNDEGSGTRSRLPDLLLAARPGSYIAIAARTLGRCGIGLLILPDTLGDAGLVMM